MYRVVETITSHTCLGIRFRDPVTGDFVHDDLKVTARSVTEPRKVITAFRTPSFVYAFKGLPGLRSIEQGSIQGGPVASPPVQKRFVVEVQDQGGRYVDVGFSVDLPLPYSGLYLSNQLSSPPQSIPKGFNLYSTMMRTPPPMIVSVRGELYDVSSEQPAAHAVVCVHTEDGFYWYGLADAQGRCATLMPYPTLVDGIGGSPVASHRKLLYEQTWQLSVEVLYAPDQVQPLPYSTLNEYSSVLNQNRAQIWPVHPEDGGAPVDLENVQLNFGKDVILKTAGFSKLMVSPAASPPS